MTPDVQQSQMLAIQAGQVFTPTSPIDEPSLFAGRLEQIRLVVDVINQKGQHTMLYGERGVGKTSLTNVLTSFLTGQSAPILAPRVNCDSQDTFASVWRKTFKRATEQYAFTHTDRLIGYGGRTEQVPTNLQELLGSRVTPDAVRGALTMLSSLVLPIIIVDEFDKLAEAPRRLFADLVKMLSDHAVRATLVLVGVADSVDELIAEHHSVERSLVQVRLPRMPPGEIDNILQTGFGKLGMTITVPAAQRISKLAQGLPHYAHLLGLHAARVAIDGDGTAVTAGIVDAAIDRAITGSQQSIRSDYERAVHSPRKDNLFGDVLLACALAETTELGYFSAQKVVQPLQEITGRDLEIPIFAQHLNDFCDPKRGPILQKSGVKRLFRYRFINPLVQPYVIMQGIKSGRISTNALDPSSS